MDYNFDHQMSLSKSKCLYLYNYLRFLNCAVFRYLFYTHKHRILIENCLASKSCWKNDLGIAPITNCYTLANIYF